MPIACVINKKCVNLSEGDINFIYKNNEINFVNSENHVDM